MSLSAFVFTAIFYSILGSLLGFGAGHIVGYLRGKAEVSNIVRGEPPDDMENEIEHFKAFRADIAERQGGPISR